ncbi:beta-phosphoglucomutase [Alteribacter aurantiacus]|uniref:beta-phosphoglucomutase n=1 Tax=Alteribacter aurantiacus TaxID=254410 RepID=UPI000419CC46|nr:beta-phosphoglucomutase [Alteribacter aurantiacus]
MGKPEAVIFDLDGVIVDTAKYHFEAWKKLAENMGFTFTEEDNERLKGVSRMDSLNILLEIGGIERSEEEKLKLATEKNEWYVSSISEMNDSEILPGAKELIQELKSEGIPIALGSVSKNAERILKNIGLYEEFDSIVDGTKITNAKPDPEVFLLGAMELNADPKKCVVFEDAFSGITAARRAGMYSVGVGDSSVLHEADKNITSLTDICLKQLELF